MQVLFYLKPNCVKILSINLVTLFMLKEPKKILKWAAISVLVVVFIVILINLSIVFKTKSKIHISIETLPKAEVVLILGARVHPDKRMSDIYLDRVQTALAVYWSGKAKKILVSGDHGGEYYDEVNTVRKFLLKEGVPAEDIFLNHAGFDTYDSMYRAKNIFGVSSVIISTQIFHLSRAIYISENLNIETSGISADRRKYLHSKDYRNRESFARIKAFLNVTFRSKSKFLGKKIPISGDGRGSWDRE